MNFLDGLLHALYEQFPLLLTRVERFNLATLEVVFIGVLNNIHESFDFLQLDIIFKLIIYL